MSVVTTGPAPGPHEDGTGHAPVLVGLAHGSRDPRAAVTIAQVMAATAALRPGLIAVPAFLDLASPDLLEAVQQVQARDGAQQAVVLPLLFTEAFHATVDVPEAVAETADATGVELTVGGILGMGEEVLAALVDTAAAAGIGADDGILLLAVGSSRAAANQAVHELAARWSARRPGPVAAGFATMDTPEAPSAASVIRRLAGAGHRVGIVPLFLAPGLLLDQVADKAAALVPDAEVRVAAPLGTALAGLVLRRYDQARAGEVAGGTT